MPFGSSRRISKPPIQFALASTPSRRRIPLGIDRSLHRLLLERLTRRRPVRSVPSSKPRFSSPSAPVAECCRRRNRDRRDEKRKCGGDRRGYVSCAQDWRSSARRATDDAERSIPSAFKPWQPCASDFSTKDVRWVWHSGRLLLLFAAAISKIMNRIPHLLSAVFLSTTALSVAADKRFLPAANATGESSRRQGPPRRERPIAHFAGGDEGVRCHRDLAKVQVVTGEPDIVQPIAYAGRSRAAVGGDEHELPEVPGEPKDSIIIFEDTDGDGRGQAHGLLRQAHLLQRHRHRPWRRVGAPPNLLFPRRTARTPAGEPQVVLDGWGNEDTHETLNDFMWPGRLALRHARRVHAQPVGKPGTPKNERTVINAAVGAFIPRRKSSSSTPRARATNGASIGTTTARRSSRRA